MIARYKQAMVMAALALLCIAITAIYYNNALNEAKLAEMDALIGQGGQIVVMHEMLSQENEQYQGIQVVGLLASETMEKIKANQNYILSILPNDSVVPFHAMTEQLQEVSRYATPAHKQDKAEQNGVE